jgi:hypothetical protein
MKNFFVALGILFLLISLNQGSGFSQEETAQPQAAVAADVSIEPETQWVWGEVLSIDQQKKEITVKYLDYESDQEKQMAVLADDKTAYENVKSLDEIKAGDTAGIDYIDLDGKLIAKNISLEKPEPANTGEEAIAQPADTNGLTPKDLAPIEGSAAVGEGANSAE